MKAIDWNMAPNSAFQPGNKRELMLSHTVCGATGESTYQQRSTCPKTS